MDQGGIRASTMLYVVGMGCSVLGCGETASPNGSGDADVAEGSLEAGADVDEGPFDAASDVADDGYSDGCASCQSSLEQACAVDGGFDCPPDLGSAAFFDWAQRQIGDHGGEGFWRAPLCYSYKTCPEMVTVVFGVGVDCAQQFAFDAVTKKLASISGLCNGVIGGCEAASGCVPNRCLSGYGASGYAGDTNASACPALPEAGLPDSGASDAQTD